MANSSPFRSIASNWTIPPATLSCPAPVARRWRGCRFSSANGEPFAPQASSSRFAKPLIGITYQAVHHAKRQDRGCERQNMRRVGFGQVENDHLPTAAKDNRQRQLRTTEAARQQ